MCIKNVTLVRSTFFSVFTERKCKVLFSWLHSRVPYNPLSANLTKWSKTLKQFVGKLYFR